MRIKKVSRKKEVKKLMGFNQEVYKNNGYWVGDLQDEMVNRLNGKKNGGFEFCEGEYLVGQKGEEIVGGVGGMMKEGGNERWKKKEVGLGWVELMEEEEVC